VPLGGISSAVNANVPDSNVSLSLLIDTLPTRLLSQTRLI
jgi:hypothetical protein